MKLLQMIYLGEYFRSFVLGNKKLKDSDLKLILEKQESTLGNILDLSQLQFAETDPIGLDLIMGKKDLFFEELKKIDSLLEKWYTQYKRPLNKFEQILEKHIQDLMGRILISEKDFEKVLGRENNDVSIQIANISRQMHYRKDPTKRRAKIKNMKT